MAVHLSLPSSFQTVADDEWRDQKARARLLYSPKSGRASATPARDGQAPPCRHYTDGHHCGVSFTTGSPGALAGHRARHGSCFRRVLVRIELVCGHHQVHATPGKAMLMRRVAGTGVDEQCHRGTRGGGGGGGGGGPGPRRGTGRPRIEGGSTGVAVRIMPAWRRLPVASRCRRRAPAFGRI